MKGLYVDENYRGKKLGDQLVNALKAEAKLITKDK